MLRFEYPTGCAADDRTRGVRSSCVWLLLACLANCGGKAVDYEYFGTPRESSHGIETTGGSSNGGGERSGGGDAALGGASATGGGASGAPPLGASGSAGAGMASGAGGVSGSAGAASGTAGSGGNSVGGAGSGGAAGTTSSAGSAGAAGTGGITGILCSTPRDCPVPPNMCIAARCDAGLCSTENVSAGSLYVLDVPADCHATTSCDGLGNATTTVDQSNAPIPYSPCQAGTCNSAGVPGTELLLPRSRCTTVPRGLCDGAGNCVECLGSADCAAGLQCAVETHTCGAGPCTDVNCGGVCAPCALGLKCLVDADCQSGACDGTSLRCVSDACSDHRLDGYETDTDCGGQTCAPCDLDQRCYQDSDCTSHACDALAYQCIASECSDHRLDGLESDVDCGGANLCSRCQVGKYCNENGDCQLGHTCSQGNACQ